MCLKKSGPLAWFLLYAKDQIYAASQKHSHLSDFIFFFVLFFGHTSKESSNDAPPTPLHHVPQWFWSQLTEGSWSFWSHIHFSSWSEGRSQLTWLYMLLLAEAPMSSLLCCCCKGEGSNLLWRALSPFPPPSLSLWASSRLSFVISATGVFKAKGLISIGYSASMYSLFDIWTPNKCLCSQCRSNPRQKKMVAVLRISREGESGHYLNIKPNRSFK